MPTALVLLSIVNGFRVIGVINAIMNFVFAIMELQDMHRFPITATLGTGVIKIAMMEVSLNRFPARCLIGSAYRFCIDSLMKSINVLVVARCSRDEVTACTEILGGDHCVNILCSVPSASACRERLDSSNATPMPRSARKRIRL